MNELVSKLNAVVDSGNPFLNETIKEAATKIERLQSVVEVAGALICGYEKQIERLQAVVKAADTILDEGIYDISYGAFDALFDAVEALKEQA